MITKPKSDPPGCTNDILSLQDTLEILGGKWKLLIIHYLITRKDQINTFKKIENDIVGISAKVLSKELKTLETNQIVKRNIISGKPISVSYSITSHGEDIEILIQDLVKWGQNHRKVLFNTK